MLMHSLFEQPFHEWLKQRRRMLDISVVELANQSACSPNTLRKLENGERRPSRELAERLAKALVIPRTELNTFIRYARSGSIDLPPAAPLVAKLGARDAIARPLTRLIGRESLLKEVLHQVIYDSRRLITLTGAGGVGKTHLALSLARELEVIGQRLVIVVELVNARSVEEALRLIGQALGGNPNLQQAWPLFLKEALAGWSGAIILDNLEHVSDLGSYLIEWLHYAPQLQIISTSRSALALQGEQVIAVPPLACSGFPETPWQEIPALLLFYERVRALDPQFVFQDEQIDHIRQICQRLDGLPLAIELAAARVPLLGLSALLNHLVQATAHDMFLLLSDGLRDASARHQTLWAAIDWSYQLLTPADQRLFRRLGVFAETWDLEAVAAICLDADGFPPSRIDLLKQLGQLLSNSLIYRVNSHDATPRFGLLATLRDYARAQMVAQGEQEWLTQRYTAYYQRRLATMQPDGQRRRQAEHFAWLRLERANLTLALQCLVAEDAVQALKFATSLWWFWYLRGYWREGYSWVSQLMSGSHEPGVLAEAHLACGALAFVLADYQASMIACEQSLALARQLGETRRVAYALTFRGMIHLRQHAREVAREDLAQSVATFRQTDDRWGLAHALNCLRQALVELGAVELAATVQMEAYHHWLAIGDQWGIALALNGLGEIARGQADLERAIRYYRESLQLFEQSGDLGNTAIVLYNLAHAHLGHAECTQALEYFRQGLRLDYQQNNREGVIDQLAGIGAALTKQEHYPAAAALLGYIMLEGQHTDLSLVDRQVYYEALHQTDQQVGMATIVELGSAMRHQGLSAIIAYALQV